MQCREEGEEERKNSPLVAILLVRLNPLTPTRCYHSARINHPKPTQPSEMGT